MPAPPFHCRLPTSGSTGIIVWEPIGSHIGELTHFCAFLVLSSVRSARPLPGGFTRGAAGEPLPYPLAALALYSLPCPLATPRTCLELHPHFRHIFGEIPAPIGLGCFLVLGERTAGLDVGTGCDRSILPRVDWYHYVGAGRLLHRGTHPSFGHLTAPRSSR